MSQFIFLVSVNYMVNIKKSDLNSFISFIDRNEVVRISRPILRAILITLNRTSGETDGGIELTGTRRGRRRRSIQCLIARVRRSWRTRTSQTCRYLSLKMLLPIDRKFNI